MTTSPLSFNFQPLTQPCPVQQKLWVAIPAPSSALLGQHRDRVYHLLQCKQEGDRETPNVLLREKHWNITFIAGVSREVCEIKASHILLCVGALCPSKSVPPHPLWPCVSVLRSDGTDSLLFISRLCLPIPFTALILLKRETGPYPFPKPRYISLSTVRTFGFHLPSPFSPPVFFCVLHFLF